MIHFKLIAVAVIIGSVVQLCISNPITSQVVRDPAIPFTAEEILRAKNAGIPENGLMQAISFGLTLDEMIKIKDLPDSKDKGFQQMTKFCEILDPGHKLASNYTSAQDEKLRNVMGLIDLMPHNEIIPFYKMMCCLEGLGDYVNYGQLNRSYKALNNDKLNGLGSEDLIEFEQQWNQFDTTKISESIERMRVFLRAKDLTDDDECKNVLSIVESSRDLNSSEITAYLD